VVLFFIQSFFYCIAVGSLVPQQTDHIKNYLKLENSVMALAATVSGIYIAEIESMMGVKGLAPDFYVTGCSPISVPCSHYV